MQPIYVAHIVTNKRFSELGGRLLDRIGILKGFNS